jgi:hypothetical protein
LVEAAIDIMSHLSRLRLMTAAGQIGEQSWDKSARLVRGLERVDIQD